MKSKFPDNPWGVEIYEKKEVQAWLKKRYPAWMYIVFINDKGTWWAKRFSPTFTYKAKVKIPNKFLTKPA
jgi:hypothetical protein